MRALVLLIALVGIVVVLTWPLARTATTHLAVTHFVARTDALVAGWVLAAQSHALATAPLEIGEGNIFYPSRHALFYGPTGTGALPLFAPVFLATGNTTLALNVTLILGLALTAWTMALVVWHWTGSIEAALLAAWVLLTSAWLMRGMVETAPFSAALFYFPLIIRLAAITTTLRQASLLALLAALQCLVDIVYMAPAVLVPLGILTLGRLARPATRRAGVSLAVALLLALLLMSPFLAGYLAVRSENPDLALQTIWQTTRMPLRLPSGLFAEGSSRAVPLFLLVFIMLAGSVEAWRTRRAVPRAEASIWAHGLLWFVGGIVVSLPPIGLVGWVPVPLPLSFVKLFIPAVGLIRTHDRLGVAALMGVALLAGAAVAASCRLLAANRRAVVAQWAPRLVTPALAVALYAASTHVDGANWPAPKSLRVFAAPHWSAAAASTLRQARGTVLELPFPSFENPKPPLLAAAMYRSTQYWRPLINGHHSYYPSDYPRRAGFAARVPDPDALAALRQEAGLAMVAVSLADLPLEDRARWEQFASRPPLGLRVVHRSPDEVLFEVVDAPSPGG